MQTTVERMPVKIKRKAITVASDNNYSYGRWFPFPKPQGETPPNFGRLKNSQRVLWCPWCDDWTIYDRNLSDTSTETWACTGLCGWSNTNEFYVQKYNNIWYENVPLAEFKKLNIPAPAPRKGKRGK